MGPNCPILGPIRVRVARKTDKISELVGSGVPNIPEIACRSYATRGTSLSSLSQLCDKLNLACGACGACCSYATSLEFVLLVAVMRQACPASLACRNYATS